MSHEVIIDGRKVALEWTQETARRFEFRIGDVGGEPTGKQLSSARTAQTAIFKILWALLPTGEFARHATPEDLFVITDNDEAPAIFAAISAIYQERFPSAEKKTTLTTSPSPESNSD